MSSKLLILLLSTLKHQQITETAVYVIIATAITAETISISSEYLAISVCCSIREALIFFAYFKPYLVIVYECFIALQMNTV